MNNDLHMLSIDINNWNLINRQVVIYTWHLAVDLWRWGYGQWSTQQKEHWLQQQMNWKAQKYIDQNIVSLLKMSMTLGSQVPPRGGDSTPPPPGGGTWPCTPPGGSPDPPRGGSLAGGGTWPCDLSQHALLMLPLCCPDSNWALLWAAPYI